MQAYKHQKEILEDPRTKLVLAWDTGTGKTFGAELLADKHNAKCLVIVPKSNKEKWDFMEQKGHHVVTKEYFRDHVSEMLSVRKEKGLDGIIIDEGHFFAGISSGMTKSLKQYSDKTNPRCVWILTATPYLSTPWNVYTLAVHCGMNPHYIKFRDMFFYQMKLGTRIIWEPKKDMDEVLHSLLSKFTVWVDFADVARDNDIEFDISNQTREVVFVKQPEDQKHAEFLLTEEGIALWTKKHTVQNGFYDDDYLGVTYYSDPKLDFIIKKAKQHPKMAIVCRYHRQMERYQTKLEDLGYDVYIIKGGVKDIENFCKILDKMEKCIVIIQANVSEGYELPSFGYAVFASLSFAYKDYKQMMGRFLRVNAITPTHIDILLMLNGVDIDVYKSVSNKQNFYLSNLVKKESSPNNYA